MAQKKGTKKSTVEKSEKVKLDETVDYKAVNNTIGSLSFRDRDDRKVLFPKPNSSRDLSLKIIKGVYDDSETMITHGHIIFPDLRVYEYLGIPKEIYSKLITSEQVERLLEEADPEEITETLKDAPLNIKEKVAITAKGVGIDSKKATKAIEKATGFKLEEEELLD